MKSIASWKTLVDRFHMRLSSWKANLLSIGGRLTLIKSVLGSLGWLNIGSFKAFNIALLQKWRWRLLSSPNALWVQVIKAYHGQEGGFDTNGCCGTRIRFWKDIWVGETPLFTRYNRLYHLDQDKDYLIIDRINNGQWSWNWSRTNLGVRNLAYLCDMLNEIGQLNIDVNEDTCTWSLGPNGTFTVKDARYRIDQNILPTLAHATTWDKSIPRKVNVFMWRLSLDRLPHRLNLSSRGMDIPAISCPSCNANVESANHVFFECDIATDMWKLVFRWCDIPLFQASSWDSFNDWIISWHASKEKKHRFYVITTSVLWWLWRYRNSVTFNSQPLRKSDLFDNVRFSSFSWLHNRDHMKLSWNDWLMYPLSITRNGNGEFTVKSFSHAIQKKLLTIDVSDMARSLSWNSWVPRKVNICAWRVLSPGIYEPLLLLMSKSQDSLAEDLELVEGSCWYSALKIYGFTGEILWTKCQGFESQLLPTLVGAPTGQGDFPELFFVEWTTVDAKEIPG
ncbi:RNA-directed DNA polymerase, eukaryota, reverse transcriptase zinc-binding domain protein, partial [Tanacetum coccineum]